jgi:hypothetical protein
MKRSHNYKYIRKCYYSKVPCYKCKYHPENCGIYNNPNNPAVMLTPEQMEDMLKLINV